MFHTPSYVRTVVIFMMSLVCISVSFRLVCDGLAEFTNKPHVSVPTISVVVPTPTNDQIIPTNPKPTLTVGV